MSFQIDDSITVVTEEELQKIEQGNVIPDGRYNAIVDDVAEVTSKQDQTPGMKFVFKIESGPFAGAHVEDTLWFTPKTESRKKLFMCRLGVLVKDSGDNYVRNPRVTSWADTLNARVVIDVETEEYTAKNGRKGKKNRLTFAGLHAPGTPLNGSNSPGGSNGKPPTNGNSEAGGALVGAGAGASKYDTSDL